jgi:Flp pilus assembly protein TadG
MRVIAHVFRRLHREERGSVLLFVVGFLPVACAVAAFVIDVGNGAEHRRHLQLQADAGALAAAQEFNGCFLDDGAANTAIEDAAIEYAGGTHNPQVGADDPQARVQTRVNATNYTTPSFSDGEPCDTGFVDVKLLEKDSPPVFGFVGQHDFRAHARVQIFRLESSNRLLPVAVPNPDPEVAAVTFIDESTGTVLASTTLTKNGNENGLMIWDNSGAPVSVPINVEHVGVRIALGGGTSTTCGDPAVVCYDAGSTHGLVHIRGWTAAGTGAPKVPIARAVTLLPGTCPDPYFTHADVSCTIGVNATVDFGVPNPVTTLGATVAATVGGVSYPLTFSGGTWSTAASIPIAPGTGPHDVGLHWQITTNADGTNCNGGQCRGDIDAVHRNFSSMPERSGPIGLAQVSEAGVMENTFQRCSALLITCSHSLVVKIGLMGQLELSNAGGPPVRLRIIGGSQNQSLDCDPAVSNLKDELAGGCSPAYTPHEDSDPACPDSPGTLWATPNPPPWDCVAVQTGNATNQIAAGLNMRILGAEKPASCTHPNQWPDWEPGDTRIIFVIVTPFGTFGGSGSTTVPVVRFAAFYITGWTGQGSGFDNPCLGNGDEMPTNPAELVGRFIQYVDTPNTGGAGGATCDFSAIDPCTAVMVE